MRRSMKFFNFGFLRLSVKEFSLEGDLFCDFHFYGTDEFSMIIEKI